MSDSKNVSYDQNVTYDQIILTSNGNLPIPPGVDLYITNNDTISTRYSPYMELIFQLNEGDTSYAVYNNFLKYQTSGLEYIETHVSDDLIIPPRTSQYYSVFYKNDKRFYTADQQIYYSFQSNTVGPNELYFTYKNNSKAICKIPNGNSTTPSGAGDYIANTINRNSIFKYYGGSPVFLLVDFSNQMNTNYGFTIWIMQSYSNQIYSVTQSNITLLSSVLKDESIVGSGNTLPDFMTYSYCNIPANSSIQAVSLNIAYLIQDGVGNSYIYLDPTYSDILYNKYYKYES